MWKICGKGWKYTGRMIPPPQPPPSAVVLRGEDLSKLAQEWDGRYIRGRLRLARAKSPRSISNMGSGYGQISSRHLQDVVQLIYILQDTLHLPA